jgi:serine/threonine protein kinase/Tol biopolymer transport system component
MNKMNPERWQQIEKLYNSALELDPSQREEFLEKACPTDESIRKEVRRLLKHQNEAEGFIESPAMEVLIGTEAKDSSSLLGRKLGSYRITSEIGRGGMGEVYQAKDQKLGRDVAIKVLPEEFSKDAERIARFKREAKLLASLNHPNIAIIYGFEESKDIHFLVLELVGGKTLADRLKHGPIPVEESLKLALQISEALEAAHEKGVIHRDLKPANIKVTPEGKVKILDFGLAKAFAGHQEELILSDSPTVSAAATRQGVLLGTAAYMSPEQAKSRAVDKRTDIWAFGAVLYEMLTGQAAFQGENVIEILASVIKGTIKLDLVPVTIHSRVREVLTRCVHKDLKARYQDIGDVRYEIEQASADSTALSMWSNKAAATPIKLRTMLLWASITIILSIISITTIWELKTPISSDEVIKLAYPLPADQQLAHPYEQDIAISPDGKQFVYRTDDGFYLRQMKEMNADLIPKTAGGMRPFFSHDGKWIGYWSRAEGKLMKVNLSEGTRSPLCSTSEPLGANWGADGTIVFSSFFSPDNSSIMRIPEKGGNLETIIELDGPVIAPQILPNGESILYTSGQPYTAIVLSLESRQRKELFKGLGARYLPTGHIVYAIENKIIARSYDLETFEFGDPVCLVENVLYAGGSTQYAISSAGTLIYLPETASSAESSQRTLVWDDRYGNEEPLKVESGDYRGLRISPDGNRVALSIGDNGSQDIHILDLIHGFPKKITSGTEYDLFPLWSFDSKRIYYSSNRNNTAGAIYCKAASGTGEAERLSFPGNQYLYPVSWSHNGKNMILLKYLALDRFDISILSMEEPHELKPLLHDDKHNEFQPQISPDGRWIAYVSTEEGLEDIYIRSFPEIDKVKEKFSTKGGLCPLWSKDGQELFYRKGNSVIAVVIETAPTLRPGESEELFSGPYVSPIIKGGEISSNPWDIHPDNQRFLMIKEAGAAASGAAGPRKINIILNWFEELKQRIPVN